MKHIKTHILVFQMLLLLGLTPYFSCGVKAQQVASETTIKQPSKLIFLNYTISKEINGKQEVRFINKITADGRLKDTSNKKVLTGDGDIECIQFDKNNLVLERTYIKNPLKPIVEYVNDDGDLEKRQLDLDNAEFSIKLQLNDRTQGIRLIMLDASGKPSTELITTPISK